MEDIAMHPMKKGPLGHLGLTVPLIDRENVVQVTDPETQGEVGLLTSMGMEGRF